MKQTLTAIACILTSCTVTNKQPHSNRVCIVVADVRYTKNNKASIRPRGHHTVWFKYPTANIHIGDTVDVSMNDRIAPKF